MSNAQILNAVNMNVAMGIRDCTCTYFSFTDFAKNNKKKIPADKYGFNLNFNVNINEKEKIVAVSIDANLQTVEGAERIANLKSVHNFIINNFENVVITVNNTKGLPDQIVAILISISLSNLRGMLSVKLENSNYSNAILPMVDSSQFIPKRQPIIG